MANNSFSDPNKLFKFLEQQIQSALKQEVAKEAVKTMDEHIHTDVYSYDAVHPENRRMYNDGLVDPDNIEIQVQGDNTISIENIAYDGDRNVPYIVESGEGYFPNASPILTAGRKFTENTREELRNSDRLQNAMRKGLTKRGLDVR